MAQNGNLQKSKTAKNDEFYTFISDVEKEISHYKQHFYGKVVYCNCDNPKQSAFWQYFHHNFAELGIRKLIATYLDINNPPCKVEYTGGDDCNIESGTKTPLCGNGDFRSAECLQILGEADIVCTNPPFSLFGQFASILISYGKKFLIVGNKNALSYKDFFPLFQDNRVWIGYNNIPAFLQPDGTVKNFGNIGWFTNLDVNKRHENIVLWQRYYEDDGVTPKPDADARYPKYDNYDAINIDKVSDIPCDYMGVMGVPISFLDKYNPNQFEIVGTDLNSLSGALGIQKIGDAWMNLYRSQGGSGNYTANMHSLVVVRNGKAAAPYKRILIRRIGK